MKTKKEVIKLLKILLEDNEAFIKDYNVDSLARDNSDYINALKWVLDKDYKKSNIETKSFFVLHYKKR